jgi:alanine-glyoxylate transaminase/serine-glyoxylate transaminase/serine-pyruvate transaminase
VGRHYLQIPGPSPEPEEVLRAISATTIDHRGPEFQALGMRLLADVREVFQTADPVIIYSASGTGSWEAALVNALSPGDEVLFYAAGHFATLWCEMAERLGLVVRRIEADWRRAIDAERITKVLQDDAAGAIKAVCVVHNETSTGILNDIPAVRAAIDAANHPALLMVDTVSGLASAEYRHDEWGVDVSIAGSQKGLMLPPGLGFNAISKKALAASKRAKMPRSYWDWEAIMDANERGFWPTTPSTNLLFGLEVALRMLREEGLHNVFERHERLARATRAAVRAWGLELTCLDEEAYSPIVTAVMMPAGFDADEFRALVLDRFDMSLGTGLGLLAGKAFRIGHLGWTNEITLIGALGGVEMGLRLVGVPIAESGVEAAMEVLTEKTPSPV